MTWPKLKPRDGSACGQCLSQKMTSYVVAYLNVVILILNFVGIIFQPSSMSPILEKMTKTEITVGVTISMICLIFAVILLIGLHKNKHLFIKAFLTFCGVYTLLMILSFVVNLFTQPSRLGFRGFFNIFINTLFNCCLFYVVRCYSLAASKVPTGYVPPV